MNHGSAKSDVSQVFLYFAPLTLLVYLVRPSSFFLDITTSYMLKDQLHASAQQVSLFRLMTALPMYFSFVFGFTRDLWNPLRRRDRGYFLLFGLVTALVFAFMAAAQLTYAMIFAGMFLVMTSYSFIFAAYQGLMALIGQEKLMSGRLSVLWQILSNAPVALGAFAAGWFATHVAPAITFSVAGAFALAIALFSFWKPQAVFGDAYDRPLAKGTDLWGDIKRLVRHRAIYPPVLMMLMFQFAPGANTPLQYYLTNTLHASDAVYGYFNGIFIAAFIPVYFVYGWLCPRVKLKTLLWWSTAITVPQMVPLAFIHTATQALWMAAPIGLMGGLFVPAIYDLAMRSCPPGLQGSLMMLVASVFELSYRGGDVVGARIFASSPEHGFLYCVIAITVVYALMLPVLLLIPKEVIATADGEANPVLDAQVRMETG